jgi:hypothetical protein
VLYALYGGLALTAMWATMRDFDLFWIGFWLVVGFVASNLLDWYMPPGFKPGPYTLIEMLVALAAYCAFVEHRMKGLIGIVGVTVASIAINVAFASILDPDRRQIHLYEVTTNICFAAETLLAIAVGVAHGRRTGRFTRWPLVRRHAAEPNVARKDGGQ